MTLERVKTLFNEEPQRQRGRSGQDVAGARAALTSLLRHMVAMPESSVRHLARLTLGDGQVTAANLARVLSVKQAPLGVAELLVFGRSGPEHRGQGHCGVLASAAVSHGLRRAVRQVPGRKRTQAVHGAEGGRCDAALRALEGRDRKGLAGGSGDGDTGAGKRMLGTLLTWMQDRRSSVFLVATANDIESLPQELMRKGRFDEISFVDLPTPGTREGILPIHLGRHRVGFDVAPLQRPVVQTEGYSGAEIEAAGGGRGALPGPCVVEACARGARGGKDRTHASGVGDAGRSCARQRLAHLGRWAYRRHRLMLPRVRSDDGRSPARWERPVGAEGGRQGGGPLTSSMGRSAAGVGHDEQSRLARRTSSMRSTPATHRSAPVGCTLPLCGALHFQRVPTAGGAEAQWPLSPTLPSSWPPGRAWVAKPPISRAGGNTDR
jgi:hypothetical protein